MKLKITIAFLLLTSFAFASDIQSFIEEENVRTYNSPDNEYVFFNNLAGFDGYTPLKKSYTINEITLGPETEGFWMIYSLKEKRIIHFGNEDMDIYSKKWDMKNGFFIKDHGTGVERTWEVYSLKDPDYYRRLSFNYGCNRKGPVYSKETDTFAWHYYLQEFEMGIDDASKIGLGIILTKGDTKEEKAAETEILPTKENHRLKINNFDEKLLYTEVDGDKNTVQTLTVDY